MKNKYYNRVKQDKDPYAMWRRNMRAVAPGNTDLIYFSLSSLSDAEFAYIPDLVSAKSSFDINIDLNLNQSIN